LAIEKPALSLLHFFNFPVRQPNRTDGQEDASTGRQTDRWMDSRRHKSKTYSEERQTFWAMTGALDTAMSVVGIFDRARRTQRHAKSFWKCLEYWRSPAAHRSIGPAFLCRYTSPFSQLPNRNKTQRLYKYTTCQLLHNLMQRAVQPYFKLSFHMSVVHRLCNLKSNYMML